MWLGASGTPNSAHNLPKIESLYSDIKLENLVLKKKNRQKNKKTDKKTKNQNQNQNKNQNTFKTKWVGFRTKRNDLNERETWAQLMLPEQISSNQLASREKMAEHELRAKRIFLEFSGIFLEVTAQVSDEFRAGLRRVPRRSPALPDLRLSRFLWTLAAWQWPQW